MLSQQTVFNYTSHVQFLNDRLNCRATADGKTIGAKSQRYSKALGDLTLAKKMGYRSSRSIGMVLAGKRLPSTSMLLQIAGYLKLDDQETRYLELLVSRERLKQNKKPVQMIESELARLNPHLADKKILDSSYLSYVSEWYHFALKQLIATPAFRSDLDWIKQRLKNKVTLHELKTALQNLQLLGLIKEQAGRLSILNQNVTTTHDLPSAKIRQHHKQMMNRACEALEEETVDMREFFSLTFRVDRKHLPELKEQIRKFKDRIERQYEQHLSNDVFQMNLQLFPHTTEHLTGQRKQNESN